MSKEGALHDILFREPDKSIEVSKLQVEALIAEVRKNAQLELLNWIMKVASDSLNTAHVRRSAQLRFEEILLHHPRPTRDPPR